MRSRSTRKTLEMSSTTSVQMSQVVGGEGLSWSRCYGWNSGRGCRNGEGAELVGLLEESSIEGTCAGVELVRVDGRSSYSTAAAGAASGGLVRVQSWVELRRGAWEVLLALARLLDVSLEWRQVLGSRNSGVVGFCERCSVGGLNSRMCEQGMQHLPTDQTLTTAAHCCS